MKLNIEARNFLTLQSMNSTHPVTILAIESSCDDTSIAIMKDGKMLSNVVASQKIHEDYGGVVPELASRAHMQNIIPVLTEALKRADLTVNDVDVIACTQSPGLLGSLIVGYNFAKGLAQSLNKPLIGVNHMKAHIMAHWIDDPQPKFPFLCMTISGGHTQLVYMKDIHSMEIIGETIDDAAGEAYDKAAKMLQLPYPGGPLIDKYAQLGDPKAFTFSTPQIPNYNYSFSGIKTSILYFLQKEIQKDPEFISKNINDLCASVQYCINEFLMKKFIKAAKDLNVTNLGIAGGVSANSDIRKRLQEVGEKYKWNVFIPEFQYCTDNAGMIAITGYYDSMAGLYSGLDSTPSAR